jgi:hypothetical protein
MSISLENAIPQSLTMPTFKSRRWRRKTAVQPNNTQIPPPSPKLSSSSSAITGIFVINPGFYVPPSLLNAMEDPVFFRSKPSSDTGETGKRKGSRRTNLRLEVENGGTDVDIRLVPTTISTNVGEDATCTGNRGQQDTFCDTPVQAQASASTSTTAFSGPPPSSTHPRQSTTSSIRMQENPVQPSDGISSRILEGISTPEVTQHTSSRRDKKEAKSTDYYRSENKAGLSTRQSKHAEPRFGQHKWTFCVPFDCTYCEFYHLGFPK